MRSIVLTTLVFIAFNCCAQQSKDVRFTYENFASEILNYKPSRRTGVSNADFVNGLYKLNNTKSAANNNPAELNSADYWNIAMAFINLNEPKAHIEMTFNKAISIEGNDICSYIEAVGACQLDEKIPEVFFEFYSSCQAKAPEISKTDLKVYSQENGLNYELIILLDQVNKADIKHRSGSGKYYDDPDKLAEQKRLDSRNQEIVDSLFNQYNQYIGTSLVGEKFDFAMWSVIQHSNQDMMERYLPVVQKAVKDNEMDVTPLKMLIDRYYGLKYGYQVFGSQSGFGFEMASEKKRVEIIKKYGID